MSNGLAQLKEENHPKSSLFCPHLWLSPISHPVPLAECPGITNLQMNPGTVEFWRVLEHHTGYSGTKSLATPPKKLGDGWKIPPLCPVLPINIPGAPPSTEQAGGKCPPWKKSHHKHPLGRRNMRIGSIFHCGGENTQPAPFPPFIPPKLQQENVLAVISISLENASPASRSNSPEKPWSGCEL